MNSLRGETTHRASAPALPSVQRHPLSPRTASEPRSRMHPALKLHATPSSPLICGSTRQAGGHASRRGEGAAREMAGNQFPRDFKFSSRDTFSQDCGRPRRRGPGRAWANARASRTRWRPRVLAAVGGHSQMEAAVRERAAARAALAEHRRDATCRGGRGHRGRGRDAQRAEREKRLSALIGRRFATGVQVIRTAVRAESAGR
jgi:hypothetical protein